MNKETVTNDKTEAEYFEERRKIINSIKKAREEETRERRRHERDTGGWSVLHVPRGSGVETSVTRVTNREPYQPSVTVAKTMKPGNEITLPKRRPHM